MFLLISKKRKTL